MTTAPLYLVVSEHRTGAITVSPERFETERAAADFIRANLRNHETITAMHVTRATRTIKAKDHA